MDNSINCNCNVSFQAQLKTKGLYAHERLINKISNEFSRISEKEKGSLLIERISSPKAESNVNPNKYNIDAVVGYNSMVIDEFKEILAKDPKDVTKQDIIESAKKLFTTFKLLKNENNYAAKAKVIKAELAKIKNEERTMAIAQKLTKVDLSKTKRAMKQAERKKYLEERLSKLNKKCNDDIEKSDCYNKGLYRSDCKKIFA